MNLLSISDVEYQQDAFFDLAIVTCGYERRSSFTARNGLRASARLAVRHADSAGLSFTENQELLQSSDWAIVDQEACLIVLREAIGGGASKFAIDISSMPRRFLGQLVQILAESSGDAQVDWLYAPATFDDSASAAGKIQSLIADPVSDFFSGGIRSPHVPVGLILGLGLEPHRSIGLVEFLEPSRVWAMLGQSDEPRFAEKAVDVNRELLALPMTTSLPYPVTSVATTFSALESLVFATQDSYRLVIAPSGPKVFGLASLLVSATAGDLRPAVWRVGGQGDAVPMDVAEVGMVVATRCEWGDA